MKLITIFNFPDTEQYNLLSKIWLEQAVSHRSGLSIEIFAERELNSDLMEKIYQYQRLGVDLKLVRLERNGDYPRLPQIPDDDKARHNLCFKLWHLCQQTEPFIFIDADAFILHDLQHLVDKSWDKPFIAIDHQQIEGHTTQYPFPFLNSGVIVCSNPSFMCYASIIRLYLKNYQRPNFHCPGRDQALLFCYCRSLDYDYRHPDVGFGWNSCAGFTDLVITSNRVVRAECTRLQPNHPVYINHYWYIFKPWALNCPLWNRYQQRIKLYLPHPKSLPAGRHQPKDTAFWQLVDMWAENNYIEKLYTFNNNNSNNSINSNTNTNYHIWLGSVGETLLYERPTLWWLENEQKPRPKYRLALFGNPIPPTDKGKDEKINTNTNTNQPWIFWGRQPKLLQRKAELKPLSFEERSIESCFLGKVENQVQAQYRLRLPTHVKGEKSEQRHWADFIDLFAMPVQGKYEYSQEEYLQKLRESKFGLCLRGFGPKCNREIELLALGTVPIMTPEVDTGHYYRPLVEGVHYLFAPRPSDIPTLIKNCIKEQWEQLSNNGRQWYWENCSAEGSFKTTLEIIGQSNQE